MLGKYYKPGQDLNYKHFISIKSPVHTYSQNKRTIDQHRKSNQRRIFGPHFNYNRVGLNKQKKYMLEEEKNTQIERANRILLEKIQKIGQRSLSMKKKNRVYTLQGLQESNVGDRTIKMNNISGRKQTPMRSTHLFMSQQKMSQFQSARKTPQSDVKVLFKGSKYIDGLMVDMNIYIEGGMYIIYAQQSKMQHKITMNIEDYMLLLKQTLDGDHNNIFDLLAFQGNLLQLIGTNKHQISITEEDQFTLPSVQRQITAKHPSQHHQGFKFYHQ